MKKSGILVMALVLLGIGSLLYVNREPKAEGEQGAQMISAETKEVTKEEMLSAIEALDPPFEVIHKEERVEKEEFDCIVLKKVAYGWGDTVTVQIGAYFDVDKEGNLINDTLFAWSMPVEETEGYEQGHITEMEKYPAENVTIRTRGYYQDRAESMDLYFKPTNLDTDVTEEEG